MRTRLADRAVSPVGNKKIPLNDSLHIACALECGCACLQSYDGDDMLVENQKHSLPGGLKLKIETPSYTPPAPPPTVPKKPAYKENDLFSSLGGELDEPYIESLKASGDGAASDIPKTSEVQASADPAQKID